MENLSVCELNFIWKTVMEIQEKLKALRRLMKKNKLSAYIIPSTDAHQSEYVPELWQRRKWISGFDGSAGDVIVTKDKAGLVDNLRYYLQAEETKGNWD